MSDVIYDTKWGNYGTVYYGPDGKPSYVVTSDGLTPVVCGRPPTGWVCTREIDHEGPCAAWPCKIDPVLDERPL